MRIHVSTYLLVVTFFSLFQPASPNTLAWLHTVSAMATSTIITMIIGGSAVYFHSVHGR
jgi:hypothetical protein